MNGRDYWKNAGEFMATTLALWSNLVTVSERRHVADGFFNWLRAENGGLPLRKAYEGLVTDWKNQCLGPIVTKAIDYGRVGEPIQIGQFDSKELLGRTDIVGRNITVEREIVSIPPKLYSAHFFEFRLPFGTCREEVDEIMGSAGYQPANVVEMLYWLIAMRNPTTGLIHPVFALADRGAKLCREGGGGRCLDRIGAEARFDPQSSFLGVLVPRAESMDWQI